MNFHFGYFGHPNEAVGIEIILLWRTIFKRYAAEHRVSQTIDNAADDLIQRATFVDQNAAIDGTIDLFQNGLFFLQTDFGNLGNVGIVRKINAKTLVDALRFFAPIRLFSNQLNHFSEAVNVVFYRTRWAVFGNIQEVKAHLNGVFADFFGNFIQKCLFGESQKIGNRRTPRSRRNRRFMVHRIDQNIRNRTNGEAVATARRVARIHADTPHFKTDEGVLFVQSHAETVATRGAINAARHVVFARPNHLDGCFDDARQLGSFDHKIAIESATKTATHARHRNRNFIDGHIQ